MAHSNFNDNLAYRASFSCFCQNWNTYNFSSNEYMNLTLDIVTHFDIILTVI